MPNKSLPLYNIQDFEKTGISKKPDFYLNRFEKHLQEHAFIQTPHKHDFFIILLITQGTGTHTIDFKTYPVAPQTAFFLSPGQVHAWQLSADSAGYILFFNLDFYRLQPDQLEVYRYPFFNMLLNRPLLALPNEHLLPTTTIIESMEQEYLQSDYKWQEVVRNYLTILLIRLHRAYLEQQPDPDVANASQSLWQQLDTFLEKHFKEHQPVSFYAEKLNITEKQLNEASKNTFGKTTSSLIQDRIILEARRLLIHSPLTITQIAAELGYFDNSYFGRFFKKHTGKTPEQFRQEK
ncbi:AraC family transcriptional regulator [Adhaeribacter radiodurans]|uniref:Helix-turn-helix domain-containing protein n=1 Tax=Adhaeribacter radiodurans TaxID=2745197 RepID=A0A7L7L210_9BACT|nr:helix-turn-helix domain-containing protein [Adhaeribacter radiodurans]QMU26826.1 helix-turn-helix domain-containing protein [Adhaeribacter radiodurans]